jgi:hypothetical protein
VVVRADIRQPAQILSDPAVRGLIDFGRPVAVIASAVLHHLLDEEDPLGAIRAVCDAASAGSCLFVSHFRTLGDQDSAALEAVMLEAFGRAVGGAPASRSGSSSGTCGSPRRESCRALSGGRTPIPVT